MSATGRSIQLLSHTPRKTDIAGIQQQLDGLWDEQYRDLHEGEAVTRACMSNLIVYCDSIEQNRDIEQSIPEIVLDHPSRVILLSGHRETSARDTEVFVSGHYVKLPSGWQVCAEQIRVVADAQSSRRLPSITRTQLIGDLPTTLWWASREAPPVTGKLFFKLASMADQIIYDSIGWTNPTRGMRPCRAG